VCLKSNTLFSSSHFSSICYPLAYFFFIIMSKDLASQNSIDQLPADVLRHHIFPEVPRPSLVAVSMVCKNWRNSSQRLLSDDDFGCLEVFHYLFSETFSLEFILWFERYLLYRFERLTGANKFRCLGFAVKGMTAK
jgi:hypothetical protein